MDDSGEKGAGRGRHGKKSGCYVMPIGNSKDVSEEIKALGHAIEEGVNSIKSEASQSMHVKGNYKRYTFDFFKPEQGFMEKIALCLPKGGAAKKKGGKLQINAFLICIGDAVKIDYTIEEETQSYNYSVTLSSGDALAVNSEVRGFSFGVAEIKAGSKPKELVLREGTLLFTVEI